MMIEGNGVTISEDYKSHWFATNYTPAGIRLYTNYINNTWNWNGITSTDDYHGHWFATNYTPAGIRLYTNYVNNTWNWNGGTFTDNYTTHWFDSGVTKTYTNYTGVQSSSYVSGNTKDDPQKQDTFTGSLTTYSYTWRNDGNSTYKIYVNYDNSKTKAGNKIIDKNINNCVFMKAYFYTEYAISDNRTTSSIRQVKDIYNAYSTSGNPPYRYVTVRDTVSYVYNKTVDGMNIPNTGAGSLTGYTDGTVISGDNRVSGPIK